MGRERIVYPNVPSLWTWESYKSKYDIHDKTLAQEHETIKSNINDIKMKIFGLVSATPKDICNENEDPFESIMHKLNMLLTNYRKLVRKDWELFIIERYYDSIKEGEESNLIGTIDEDTGKPWKPYIWICGIYAENEYTCESEIKDSTNVLNMLIEKLTMYVTSSPSNCYENTDEETSFDTVFFDVRNILDKEDGLEYYWWEIFNWEFVRENFNEDSYNSY